MDFAIGYVVVSAVVLAGMAAKHGPVGVQHYTNADQNRDCQDCIGGLRTDLAGSKGWGAQILGVGSSCCQWSRNLWSGCEVLRTLQDAKTRCAVALGCEARASSTCKAMLCRDKLECVSAQHEDRRFEDQGSILTAQARVFGTSPTEEMGLLGQSDGATRMLLWF